MAATTAPGGYHQPATLEEVRTLWIGDLQYWADESYLTSCFAHTGEVAPLSHLFSSSSSSSSSSCCLYICVFVYLSWVSLSFSQL
jgi:hypothetical protein